MRCLLFKKTSMKKDAYMKYQFTKVIQRLNILENPLLLLRMQ